MAASRRTFLKQSALALAAGAVPFGAPLAASRRAARFALSLSPGMIGVSVSQRQAIDLAVEFGFSAVTCAPGELVDAPEAVASTKERMAHTGLQWDAAGLPVEFRQDRATFEAGLKALKAQAAVMEQLGATRMGTWIMPTHDSRTYRENFALHTERLRQCAEVAGEHGVRLGLEYVGPKTLMSRDKFAFIRTLAEARELITAIDRPNVGLVLDSFHWFCASDTVEDLLALSPDDIVTVDLNDARDDLSRDEQIDNRRHLPLETGVIDMKTFLTALQDLGYRGPVRAEPFSQALNELPDRQAVQKTAEAMQRALSLV